MPLKMGTDRGFIPPSNVGIHQAIGAASGQVVIAEAKAAPIVHVVVELQIASKRHAREPARLGRTGLEHDHHLRTQQLARAHDAPRLGRVLGGDAIWMRPIRHLRGQLEHAGSERREHGKRARGRRRGLIRRCLHRLEIRPHGGDRLAIGVPAQGFDHGHVRYTEPEQEAVFRLLAQAALRVGHGHCIARVDVGYSRRHVELAGAGEQPCRVRQDVASPAFRHPQRPIAKALDAARQIEPSGRGQPIERHPNAELAEIHGDLLMLS